jgi:hypothetical protein
LFVDHLAVEPCPAVGGLRFGKARRDAEIGIAAAQCDPNPRAGFCQLFDGEHANDARGTTDHYVHEKITGNTSKNAREHAFSRKKAALRDVTPNFVL